MKYFLFVGVVDCYDGGAHDLRGVFDSMGDAQSEFDWNFGNDYWAHIAEWNGETVAIKSEFSDGKWSAVNTEELAKS